MASTLLCPDMFAVGVVQTGIRDSQIFQHFAANDRLLDDAIDVSQSHPAIENALWIDRHGGAVLALFETPTLIRTDQRVQTTAFDFRLERRPQRCRPIWIATAAAVAGATLVAANENMMSKSRHIARDCTRSVQRWPARHGCPIAGGHGRIAHGRGF